MFIVYSVKVAPYLECIFNKTQPAEVFVCTNYHASKILPSWLHQMNVTSSHIKQHAPQRQDFLNLWLTIKLEDVKEID